MGVWLGVVNGKYLLGTGPGIRGVWWDVENANPRVDSFDQLKVYQAACRLEAAVFDHSKGWPREEIFAPTSQIRRSSRSVGANLAEAWAKRRYPAHFLSKLTDADAELQETLHWLMRAQAYGYLSGEQFIALQGNAREVGSSLGAMMQSRHHWSSPA